MQRFHPTRRQTSRSGFTLVELLAVLVVIAILVGLLMPAVGNVRNNVRDAQVRTEISQLEAGIAAFRLRFQMDPPSRIFICENPIQWTSPPSGQEANISLSLAIMKRMWPRFNPAQHDINGDGDNTDILELTGGMSGLLPGGILTPGTNPTSRAAIGFAKSPSDPFNPDPSLQREGPFFEFRPDRFTDIDGDGCVEYKDPLPGQTMPYQYFSGYDGEGYHTDEFASSGNELRTWYRQTPPSEATNINGGGGTNFGNVFPGDRTAYKLKGFQIISPGADKLYGPGGPYIANADGGNSLPPYELFSGAPAGGTFLVEITADQRMDERDNITNFSQGRLAR